MTASYKDIARESGVSVATVQRVLNGDNKETWPSTRERAARVRCVAEELGFRKNLAAKAMRSMRFGHVGVLLRDNPSTHLLDDTLYEIILGINAGLEKQDYSLVIVRLGEDMPREPRPFRENMLDGLIVLGNLPEEINHRAALRIPRVIWVESSRWEAENCLRRDELTAGRMAVDGLLASGRRKLFYFGSSGSSTRVHYSQIERLQGVKRAAAEAGIKLEQISVGMENIDKIFSGLPISPEVGIVTYNHDLAERILPLANQQGLKIGEDFGLASCDSIDKINGRWPELSRVKMYRFNIGIIAAEMILNMIENNKNSRSQRYPAKWDAGKTA